VIGELRRRDRPVTLDRAALPQQPRQPADEVAVSEELLAQPAAAQRDQREHELGEE
jgi:hypothetical protein